MHQGVSLSCVVLHQAPYCSSVSAFPLAASKAGRAGKYAGVCCCPALCQSPFSAHVVRLHSRVVRAKPVDTCPLSAAGAEAPDGNLGQVAAESMGSACC